MVDFRYQQQADFPAFAVELDFLLSDLNLIEDGLSLQSAVIIALGSDARADSEEELPGFDDLDRRGWWGDADAAELWGGWPLGSKLWLLERAKISSPLAKDGGTLNRAENYARDAMQPFIDNRICTEIGVQAERTDTSRIDVGIVIYRGAETAIELRYAELWEELGRT